MNSKTKKTPALRFLLVLSVLLILLLMLNFIIDSYEAKSGEQTEETMPPYTERNLGDHHFAPANPSLDIMQDENYLRKDRILRYTFGSETHAVEDNHNEYGRFCVFFGDYFNALMGGDAEALNKLLSEDFIEENGKYNAFNKQKVYSMRAVLSDSPYVIEEAGKFYGITRAVFEVTYKILDNDGTFRRDIIYDEELPLLFELLDDGKSAKLNSIGHIRYAEVSKDANDSLELILPIVFSAFLVIFAILAIILKKLTIASVAFSSLIAFISAMLDASVTLQIIIFAVSSVIFIALFLILCKKKQKPEQKPEPENDEKVESGENSDNNSD